MDKNVLSLEDADWHRMEEERPWLYNEVVSWVEPDSCEDHISCVRASNRYRDLVSRGGECGASQGVKCCSTNSCDKIECHPM